MLEKFYQVTQMLEVSLGPDTGELGLRVGMHSGPVTAGILRGSGGRYQVRNRITSAEYHCCGQSATRASKLTRYLLLYAVVWRYGKHGESHRDNG